MRTFTRLTVVTCLLLGASACSSNDAPSNAATGGNAGASSSGSGASGGSGGATGGSRAPSTGGATAAGSGGDGSGGGASAAGGSGGSGGASAGQPGGAAGASSGGPFDASVADVGRVDANRPREAAAGESGPGLVTGGCGSAKVCDDFEAYAAAGSLAPWTSSTSGGTLKIDATHVWSGKQAIQVHADPGANKRAQLLRAGAPLFPAQPNALWGRMMVYATNLPPSSVHYDNVQADGASPGQYRIGGMGGILLNYEPHDCYNHISTPIPQNKWTCWQWLYDGAASTVEFYIDGVLQAKVNGTAQGCVDGTNSTWTAPTFTTVRLGWVNYQSMPAAVDLWIDDVALGAERIACPAAGDSPH